MSVLAVWVCTQNLYS